LRVILKQVQAINILSMNSIEYRGFKIFRKAMSDCFFEVRNEDEKFQIAVMTN
jgi:hypothetical protein